MKEILFLSDTFNECLVGSNREIRSESINALFILVNSFIGLKCFIGLNDTSNSLSSVKLDKPRMSLIELFLRYKEVNAVSDFKKSYFLFCNF